MKKILMAIVLCLVCTVSFGQYQIINNHSYKLNDSTFLYSDFGVQSQILLPKVIYDEYKLGTNMTIAGSIILCTAIPVLCAALGCYVPVDINNDQPSKLKAGVTLTSIGCCLIATSIPLLCWGDHLKRTASKDFELLQFKNNIVSTDYSNH